MIITKLNPNEIFVFGSNMAGRHGAGAARQAAEMFGAKYGVGEGLTGQCYAFPTLDRHLQQVSESELRHSRDILYAVCIARPDKRFLLTKVGCGLAGYPEDTMRALFSEAPANLILPEDWI
jgi:hypothetical protein